MKDTLDRLCKTRKQSGVSTLMGNDERVLVVFLCSEIDKLQKKIEKLEGENSDKRNRD